MTHPYISHTPWVVFDYLCGMTWARGKVTFKELRRETEKIRKAHKKAGHYTWDNDHFHVTDISGCIALQLQFSDNHIALWDFRGHSLPSIVSGKSGLFEKEHAYQLDQYVEGVSRR